MFGGPAAAQYEARMPELLERHGGLKRVVLLALLAPVLGIPIFAQSNAPDPAPAGDADKASESSQESKQPVTDPKAAPSTPLSPEELRQAEIEENTKKLFQLSAELRAEVAKTYKETLSLTVLKKAEEIEKRAKSLKAQMNREAAAAKQEGKHEEARHED
jgi:hypothetical protein